MISQDHTAYLHMFLFGDCVLEASVVDLVEGCSFRHKQVRAIGRFTRFCQQDRRVKCAVFRLDCLDKLCTL